MTTTDGLNALVRALRDMAKTGSDGFEGFVRNVLRHALGRHIRLLKSGPQHGGDMLADSRTALPEMVIECKRYTRKLSFDELRTKLEEALRERPNMELWVVATTVDINARDVERLRDIAGDKYVSVECLDWDDSAGAIPSLAALCARVPDLVQAKFPALWPAFKVCVDARKAEFERLGDDIVDRLSRPDCGYALAQAKAEGWLRTTLASPVMARRNLRSRAGLTAPETRRIRRDAIMQGLDDWWSDGAEAPCVLLGKEGMGKTWAILAWCLERFEKDAEPPLVLVVSAGDVDSTDAERTFDQILRKATASDALRWDRVEHWAKHGDDRRILVIVDGLNQNFGFDWRDFLFRFERLVMNETSVFALALTCRPEYWERDLQSPLQASGEDFTKIPVGPFDDAELEAFLRLHGHSTQDFPEGLRAVMSVPRLSELAMELSAHLSQVGEVTREMLYLAEWAHRRRVNADAGVLDPRAIKRFAGELAHRFLNDPADAISCQEILKILDRNGGQGKERLGNALSDIVDGHWLNPGGDDHCYLIEPQALPYVVGLDLVEQARRKPEPAAVREVIAEYTEPASGGDFAAQVLRAATAVAIYGGRVESVYDSRSRRDDEVPASVKEELLAAWLTSQNFGEEDEDEAGRLIGADPVSYLDVAERLCSDGGYEFRSHDVLVRAFVRGARRVPAVLDALKARLPSWVGEAEQYRLWSPASLQQGHADAITRSLAHASDIAAALKRPWTADTLVKGGASLQHNAFRILSHLPRAPFVDTLTAWAVSKAVFNTSDHAEETSAAWILRLNPQDRDNANEILIAEAVLLESSGDRFGATVGWHMRWMVGSRTALAPLSPALEMPARSCPAGWIIDGQGRLTRDRRKKPLQWSELKDLGEHASDSRVTLDTTALFDLADMVRRTSLSDMLEGDPTAEADPRDNARVVLLRWAPALWAKTLGSHLRSRAAMIDTDFASMSMDLSEDFLIVTPEALDELSRASLEVLRSQQWEGGFLEPYQVRDLFNCVMLGLAGKSAQEQVALLSDWPDGASFEARWAAILARPDAGTLMDVLARIEVTGQPAERQAWLGYLSFSNLTAMPAEGSRILARLVSGTDLESVVLPVLLRCPQRHAASALAQTDWISRYAPPRDTRLQGSFILASKHSGLSLPELVERIHITVLPWAVEQRGCQPDDVAVLRCALLSYIEASLRGDFDNIAVSGPETFPDEISHRLHAPKAHRVLWREHRAELEPLLEAVASRDDPIRMGEGPLAMLVRGLLCAAMTDTPEVGIALWQAMHQRRPRHGFPGHEAADLLHLPFTIDGPAMSPLRRRVLELAFTDDELATSVRIAMRHGRSSWLLSTIEAGFESADTAWNARALTLAGLLDESPAADALWERISADQALRGWLDDVRRNAAKGYRRNAQARHWLRQFLSASDDAEALAGHALFLACVGPQVESWADSMVATAKDLPERRLQHWRINRARIDEKLRSKESTFFHTPICKDLHPWTTL
ncbi:hypothetical protein Sp245p_31855 (plasmid) [Azospirillum baldaniorum]|uniref:NACHT domain-containing protein n=2 Tax=Azospirillum baldaniorum TaxID=1064539 RepID=A0A9P1K1R9_9PROT|nr:hypothetical protein [Azospirillum baldaniorum]AWJ94442.1 hypothetical protein Sp245p_31855 [Azospirillum baldaniorum]TWA68741.1 hypothetical protein FBZ85_1304 [Azospirillum brasilense]CCD03935.1 protein of unknown function [Azospirillum baldaniorum]